MEKENLTPELEAEELKATQAIKEEEVRENIVSEYGFDEDDDKDKIDKLVEKEMESAKKLSSAIGQKIKHREEATKLQEQIDKPSESKDVKIDKPEVNTEDLDKTLDKKLDARLEQRELENLDYSDELKDEIKRISDAKGIKIKEVLRDPYITFKIEEHNKEQKVDEATISRTSKSKGSVEYSMEAPPVVDMNTEEGRKEWEDYKLAMKEKGN